MSILEPVYRSSSVFFHLSHHLSVCANGLVGIGGNVTPKRADSQTGLAWVVQDYMKLTDILSYTCACPRMYCYNPGSIHLHQQVPDCHEAQFSAHPSCSFFIVHIESTATVCPPYRMRSLHFLFHFQ
jgi:hypothetical protein